MLSKVQQSELITAIRGRGEIPLKFAYLGEGAHNWEQISNGRSEEGINETERSLLSKRVQSFLSTFAEYDAVNVIDIGCGNGKSTYPILDEVTNTKSVRYTAVDISEKIIDNAVDNIRNDHPSIETARICLDFERGPFPSHVHELTDENTANLLLFLGSTLGNHSDKQRVLANFRDSMTADDYIILGVELTNLAKKEKILSQYQGPLHKDFVYFIPDQIGINRRETTLEVTWNDSQQQVESRIVLEEKQDIRIGDAKFVLEEGERLLVGRSTKFTEGNITNLLSRVGFRIELLTTTRERDYVLSMVQPTRYSV